MAKPKEAKESGAAAQAPEPQPEEVQEVQEPEEAAGHPLGRVEGRVMRYVGTSNDRTIREKDWKSVGIDHTDVTWFRDPPFNDVPLERLRITPQQFSRVFATDPDFRLVELEGP